MARLWPDPDGVRDALWRAIRDPATPEDRREGLRTAAAVFEEALDEQTSAWNRRSRARTGSGTPTGRSRASRSVEVPAKPLSLRQRQLKMIIAARRHDLPLSEGLVEAASREGIRPSRRLKPVPPAWCPPPPRI